VGCGTLSVQPLVFRLVCRNGLIASDHALRQTHVGRALGAETESVNGYRDDTLAADDRAFFLKVRDVVEAAVSETTLRQIALKMRKTREIPLTGAPVEVLANRYTLNDTERAGVLRHLIVEGDLTAYGLVMSVFSPGAAARLAGRLLFSVAKPMSAEPIALRDCGARGLRMAPKMGDTTADEGHCEEQPAEVLGASGLC
jgi:hypothetical protein